MNDSISSLKTIRKKLIRYAVSQNPSVVQRMTKVETRIDRCPEHFSEPVVSVLKGVRALLPETPSCQPHCALWSYQNSLQSNVKLRLKHIRELKDIRGSSVLIRGRASLDPKTDEVDFRRRKSRSTGRQKL